MREYKFRAWDKKDKEMISEKDILAFYPRSKTIEILGKKFVRCYTEYTQMHEEHESDVVLMMSTGVKERYPQMVGEGQEIYLGDVVRLFGGEYCQGYYEHDQTIVVKSAYDIVAMEESENVQLLGNRWDNPELLKEVE